MVYRLPQIYVKHQRALQQNMFLWGRLRPHLDDPSISAPVQAMVDFILQTFPEYQAFPSRPSSRSFDYLLFRTWQKRFPRRSDFPVILRMGRLATPFCILSTSLKGSRICPLRGKNCRRIPTFWTSFGTRSPIVAMCPCRLKIPLP